MAKSFNKRLRELDSSRSTSSRSTPPPPRPGRGFDDEPPLELAALILFGLIGTVVLGGLATLFGLRAIENNLETRAERLLAARGITGVEIDANGLDVSIVGVVELGDLTEGVLLELPDEPVSIEDVPTETLQEWLVGRVQRLSGIGEISANVVFQASRDPGELTVAADALTFRWSRGAAVVAGTLSDQASVDAVTAVVEEVFRSVDTSGLSVREGIASERDWLSTVTALLREMSKDLEEGEIIVNPDAGVVKVSAEFETRERRGAVRDEVEDILAATTFDFSSGLTVIDQPRVTQEDVVEVQARIDDLIEGKVVEFEFNSAVITSEGRQLLDEVLEALRLFPEVPIEIAGHTDDIGSAESNLELSQERANAVLAYLVDQGEDPARFDVVGYGEDEPVAENDTEEGRARNRRIEFKAFLDEEATEEQ